MTKEIKIEDICYLCDEQERECKCDSQEINDNTLFIYNGERSALPIII